MTEMDDEDQRQEAQALAENELIDAARELIEDYGYTKEDVLGILKGTVFGDA